MTEITVIRDDITTLQVDAIVNAANRELAAGGGVDGAIRAAGGPAITEATSALGPVDTGQAVATTGGDLPARHVINTVGPIWGGLPEADAGELLGACYRNSLTLAAGLEAGTVAFPNISTGIYGFPLRRAAKVAIESVNGWIESHPDTIARVIFVCFDEENHGIYRELLGL